MINSFVRFFFFSNPSSEITKEYYNYVREHFSCCWWMVPSFYSKKEKKRNKSKTSIGARSLWILMLLYFCIGGVRRQAFHLDRVLGWTLESFAGWDFFLVLFFFFLVSFCWVCSGTSGWSLRFGWFLFCFVWLVVYLFSFLFHSLWELVSLNFYILIIY